jgi:hypothetical protein
LILTKNLGLYMQPTGKTERNTSSTCPDVGSKETQWKGRDIKRYDPKGGRACFIILITFLAVGILLSQGHIWGSLAIGVIGLLSLANKGATDDSDRKRTVV